MHTLPSYVHPLPAAPDTELPRLFTFPFRYVPHPLCREAAVAVQQHLGSLGPLEGKMYGVLIVRREGHDGLFFLAAYSGQLRGSYAHPWFVPPVVDYLAPDSYFQRQQSHISAITASIDALRSDAAIAAARSDLEALRREQSAAVAAAKAAYTDGRIPPEKRPSDQADAQAYIRRRQHEKADIARARRLHREEIAAIEQRLQQHNAHLRHLAEERRSSSEALQQWLFAQFRLLNAHGQQRDLIQIFGNAALIPSGAGECCAPKLLQAAYTLGLQPLAMAEFWWGPSRPDHYRQPGAFFPACRSKCLPILRHMLSGLDVATDPALHYEDRALPPVTVLWQDADLAIILKPQGWCSIPGRSDQANILDEAYRLWPDIQGSVIVHRLDQDTSGILLIAKNPRTHSALSRQFELRQIHKRYVALLDGYLPPSPASNPSDASPVSVPGGFHDGNLPSPLSTISLPIAPDLDDMPRRRIDHATGKEAVTLYRIIGYEQRQARTVTRVEFFPQTGRTHQLRLHSAAPEGLGIPILGDRLYGTPADRLYLHAESITFTHPTTHQTLHFEAKAPF